MTEAKKEKIYPPNPPSVPLNLTALPRSYMLRASLAVFSILLFFILYAALVVALGYLVYLAVNYNMGDVNKLTILMKVGAIAGSVMLFIFTLKFVFKLKNHRPENRILLKEETQKNLWEFVRQICISTGAPRPKNIYIDPDVNAYVSYTNTWLSLFLPVKKELTIGLGLVSCLNLSEFKAVISHEFGHFAQRSMKIGSYIHSANTIIHDMIFSRDKWDDVLDQWRASDLRLSAAAWVITPIIWLIRQVLNLFYQFLNIMNSSLSREMEFNADKVAVSTSGSESIISGLWKLDGGSENWNETVNIAYLASQKKIYSDNLYVHNLIALENDLSKQIKELESLPEDKRGGKLFFSDTGISKASMYASHPPNDKREENAKTPFVACEIDARSPWEIFENDEELQKKMTSLIYDKYLSKKPTKFVNVEDFQSFKIQESHGKELLKEYGDTFLNRFLHIDEEDNLLQKSNEFKKIDVNMVERLKTDLEVLMKPVRGIEMLMSTAQNIANGTSIKKSFVFKENTYTKKNLDSGYQLLQTERERLFEKTFKEWDNSFCAIHLALAKEHGQEESLMKLYRQHNTISDMFLSIVKSQNQILSDLNQLQSKGDVTEGEINRFKRSISKRMEQLNQMLDGLGAINFVPMPNIETPIELKEAIIDGGSFKIETGDIFENDGFNRTINSLQTAISHCQRIDQKSIGVILGFHKNLVDKIS